MISRKAVRVGMNYILKVRFMKNEKLFKNEDLCSLYKTNNYEGLNRVLLKYYHSYKQNKKNEL